jgi:sugar lactone lactonase YvrE
MRTLLDLSAAQVFFDGFSTTPRLDHPEGVAVDPADSSIWCGGEDGQLYRIPADGSAIELRAHHPGGFTLGVTVSPDGHVVWLDAVHRAVYSMPAKGGDVSVLGRVEVGGHALHYPNAAAFSSDGTLYVSDSHAGPSVAVQQPGPGLFRFATDGSAGLWSDEPFSFANGVAVSPDDRFVYVAESDAHRISRVPILADGSAGTRQTVVEHLDEVPDGLAFGPDGLLYVACYYPSRLLRISRDGSSRVLLDDPRGHILSNPANIAFQGTRMFVSNLGRWHITRVDLPASTDLTEGVAL